MNKMLPFNFVTFALLLSCNTITSSKSSQNILLFKDKDGIYEFDFKTKKESLVLKVDDKDIFLDEPYVFTHDTLIVGLQDELIKYDLTEKIKRETYTKKYVSVNLKNGRHWVSKTVRYDVYRSDTLEITTEMYNLHGKKQSASQKSVKYEGEIRHSKGIDFGRDRERQFYWESTVGGHTVFSDMGNLFMVSGKDTVLLSEMEGRFNPKFVGSGYGQPQIHPSGKFVICNYSVGGILAATTCLAKIDLNTKNITKIKDGRFLFPVFSADGNFVLFKRNLRQGEINFTWIYDIYLLDLQTNEEYKIGEANDTCWNNE